MPCGLWFVSPCGTVPCGLWFVSPYVRRQFDSDSDGYRAFLLLLYIKVRAREVSAMYHSKGHRISCCKRRNSGRISGFFSDTLKRSNDFSISSVSVAMCPIFFPDSAPQVCNVHALFASNAPTCV